MEDRNPMEGDEIRAIFNGENPDDIEPPSNPMLDDVIDIFNCFDVLPLAHRIIWLSSVKEAVGYIPDDIPIDYEELKYLVVLQEERDKKLSYENYKMRQDSNKYKRQADSGLNAANASVGRSTGRTTSSVGLQGAIKK